MNNDIIFKTALNVVSFGILSEVISNYVPDEIERFLKNISNPCIFIGSIIAFTQCVDNIKDAILNSYQVSIKERD